VLFQSSSDQLRHPIGLTFGDSYFMSINGE